MNNWLKEKIKNAGLTQWRVALEMGISEATFIRWLRTELTQERRQRVLDAIERLKGGDQA